MTIANSTVETIFSEALALSPRDKALLIKRLASALERELLVGTPAPLRSLHGILAGEGSSLSAEEIDDARREMWASVSRDDLG